MNTIQSNLKASDKHLQYEKMYLKKMQEKNKASNLIQLIDDYYTKGITAQGDDEEEPFSSEDDTSDDDNYNNDERKKPLNLFGKISKNDFKRNYHHEDDTITEETELTVNNDIPDLGSDFLINPNILSNIAPDNTLGAIDNPYVSERIEWQSMLKSVLTGEVVKQEKTKITVPTNENEKESYLHATYKENLWIGIRSKIYGRTEDEQKKLIMYSRPLADDTINEILNFKIVYGDIDISKDDKLTRMVKEKMALDQVTNLLNKYEKVEELWRTHKEMCNDRPICLSPEFVKRIKSLNSWKSIVSAINHEMDVIKEWIGNDELDILKSGENSTQSPSSTSSSLRKNDEIFHDDRSFVERVLKEKDVNYIFEKRIFSSLGPWVIKAKRAYLEFKQVYEELNLPAYLDTLIDLANFPSRLIKELLNVRLGYAKKLKNPTMMLIDQMMDDLKTYLKLAFDIKVEYLAYCFPEEGWTLENYWDPTFDETITDAVSYYCNLLNRKLLDSSRSQSTFRTFREPEDLEKEWYVVQNLGLYVDNGGSLILENFSLITSRLVTRLSTYIQIQFQGPPVFNKTELIRWYSSAMENFGALRRKLIRFVNTLNQHFQNAVMFSLKNNKIMKSFLENLKETGHFLIYTDNIEKKGVYLIASGNLINKPSEIERLLNGSKLGTDRSQISKRHLKVLKAFQDYEENQQVLANSSLDGIDAHERHIKPISLEDPNLKDYDEDNDEEEDDSEPGYVLAICPLKPMVWDGKTVNIDMNSIPIIDIKPGKLLLISEGGSLSNLVKSTEDFLDCVDDTIGPLLEKRSSLPKVNHELLRINRIFYRMLLNMIDCVPLSRNQCKGVGDCQALVNDIFIYVRDSTKSALRMFENYRKSEIIVKLIQLSIEWVSFIVDDCVPTDLKTFRWCVLALEFAMEMTNGLNILTLTDEQFYILKVKVGGCMSLLISHFDIMGARSTEREKKRLLNWSLQKQKNLDLYEKDEDVIAALREDIMKNIADLEDRRYHLQVQQQNVGRVLDDNDSENQFLTFLASSFSSVSIRWQKGRFIGGGTFGSVYASINLDSGGVMAVKEIRFQDSKSMKNVVPAIKDEMTVLEMLSHPNIVQYFGVEVHRDKVYLFMEFCEGGSLASLLEHGRIEDETVIQVYTLQMLEGLAYLHQSGIVHRDVKPENILLDHMGIIKFVDFGAAKVIAAGGRTKDHHNISKKLNSMTGTPMYMSPEVITGSSTGRHGSVDIWSLGCCVLEMATGRRPWANLDNEWAIMYHIAAGHLPQFPNPDQLSEAGLRFLSKCLEHDPNKRLSALELLSDPWIMNIRNELFGDISSSSSDVGDNQ